MDARKLFPSVFLAAHDLDGKDVTLTIRALVQEELKTDRGGEDKWILYFEETAKKAKSPRMEKRMVMNKTNAKTIMAIHGSETDDWVGKKIVLYPTKTPAFGEIVDCIRVRENVPVEAGA